MRHKLDKDTAALADEIGATPPFAGVDRAALVALAGVGRLLRVPADWAVLIESQPADSAYLILDGSAEVRKQGTTLVSLGVGQLVGEAALVQHRTRNASVVTTTPVRVVRFSYEDLERLFPLHPAIEQVFTAEHHRRAASTSS